MPHTQELFSPPPRCLVARMPGACGTEREKPAKEPSQSVNKRTSFISAMVLVDDAPSEADTGPSFLPTACTETPRGPAPMS